MRPTGNACWGYCRQWAPRRAAASCTSLTTPTSGCRASRTCYTCTKAPPRTQGPEATMTRLWLAMVYNGQCVGPYELTGKRGEKPIPRGTLSKVFYLGLWLLAPGGHFWGRRGGGWSRKTVLNAEFKNLAKNKTGMIGRQFIFGWGTASGDLFYREGTPTCRKV